MGCGEYILRDGVLQNIVGWTCCSCFFLERMDQFGKTIPRGRHSPGVLKNSLWLIEEHRCVLLLILSKVYYRDQFAAKPYECAAAAATDAVSTLSRL